MHSSQRDTDEILAYVEAQAHERVVHLEKAATELVGPVRHNIWDVHCASSRWWVVTNPTNLYGQADFKSRDVALTFHIGLMLRVEYAQEREVPLPPKRQTSCSARGGDGSRRSTLRERRRSRDLSGRRGPSSRVPGLLRRRHPDDGFVPPGTDDRRGPTSRAGPNCWRTSRGRRVVRPTAVIAEELAFRNLGVCQLADARQERRPHGRRDRAQGRRALAWNVHRRAAAQRTDEPSGARECDSYEVVAGVCRHCEWADPAYEVPEMREWSDDERRGGWLNHAH